MVKQIAKALHWPLISLSPSFFLRTGGLEGFEARAVEIFSDLMRLRRVVVLLDECEDFFKSRLPLSELKDITTGILITPSMLPRLTDLHNKKWIIFMLATNSKVSELDEAAIRRGRFDRALEISHPTLSAQKRYIESRSQTKDKKGRTIQLVPLNVVSLIKSALAQYDRNRGRDQGAPRVSFGHLDDLLRTVPTFPVPKIAEIAEELKNLLERKGPPSLI